MGESFRSLNEIREGYGFVFVRKEVCEFDLWSSFLRLQFTPFEPICGTFQEEVLRCLLGCPTYWAARACLPQGLPF